MRAEPVTEAMGRAYKARDFSRGVRAKDSQTSLEIAGSMTYFCAIARCGPVEKPDSAAGVFIFPTI